MASSRCGHTSCIHVIHPFSLMGADGPEVVCPLYHERRTMGSYDFGKQEVCEWIRENVPRDESNLDVGACDGKWRKLLPEYTMDAVEAFEPNAANITDLYRYVYNDDIYNLIGMDKLKGYGLIIFGDVIEHMMVYKAKAVLGWAVKTAPRVVVGVPFLYKQGPIYGNPWEIHIQDDLTEGVFFDRYPGFEVLYRAAEDYCYYINRPGEANGQEQSTKEERRAMTAW